VSATTEVRQRILAANEEAARGLRTRFARDRTLVFNLISSPGSGKTALLEATAARLQGELRFAVIEGDIATERDAQRIARLGVPAHQILTGGACHLDARQVQEAFGRQDWGALDALFIENVGNLICPTSYDLGEDAKVVLLSVTEGEDKPFKYPAIFTRAEITVITKIDLLPHVPFQLDEVLGQVRTLRPDGRILQLSSRTGEGMDEWCALVRGRVAAKRGA